MREIPLTRGKVALVDDADYEHVSRFKWTALFNPDNGKWYARRVSGGRTLYLHRFLMSAAKGVHVDHKNGDGLDCRRGNLRFADNSQNHQNMRRLSTNTSGYKGVHPRGRRWVATITLKKKSYWCGTYDTAEDAARAYDEKALELFGEFALPNFAREENAA